MRKDQTGTTQAPQLDSRSARRRRRRKRKRRTESKKEEVSQSLLETFRPIIENPLVDRSGNHSGALPSLLTVSNQFNPWADFAHPLPFFDTYETKIRIEANSTVIHICMYTPVYLSEFVLDELDIGIGIEKRVKISFDSCMEIPVFPVNIIESLRRVTSIFLSAAIPKYAQKDEDYLVLFCPEQIREEHFALNQVSLDPVDIRGSRQASPIHDYPWTPPDTPILQAQTDIGNMAALVATIPRPYIPFLVSTLEMRLVAERLRNTILADVGFSTLDHVLPAITTPYTRARANYQRYEFFGDATLKYIVSCQLFFHHPDWSEGDLSKARDQLVQNHRLTRAALNLGLDAFVLERRVNLRKWSAPTIGRNDGKEERDISAKILADVVEALIGAAYLDGGILRATACVQKLLPELQLSPMHNEWISRDSGLGIDIDQERSLLQLQASLGYTFKDPSLLVEALTHPSFAPSTTTNITTTKSYQRLEFLGDAVLDMILISRLASHTTELPEGDMSMIKHALTNQHLLAFLCLEFPNFHIPRNSDLQGQCQGLWNHMYPHAPFFKEPHQAVLERYVVLRGEIDFGLNEAKEWPWQSLISLNADKYFSDLIESVLAAIFVDSGRDFAMCEQFLRRIGLLSCLDRVLSQSVEVSHPKNIVQKLSKSLAKFALKRTSTVDISTVMWDCTVSVGDVQIAEAEPCLNREEAEVKAATAAIQILKDIPWDAPDRGDI
ncbi:ribonuclease III domain-containing protein [Aspergillus heterothallicus]